jgi:hypothetical protein
MRKIYMLMLSLIAMFAFSAIVASLASATTYELLCVSDEKSTIMPKYETEAKCLAGTPVDESGNWHLGFEWLVNGSAVPSTGVTVDITTTKLLLEDMQAGPLKQATDILCEGTGLGLLLPEGQGTQNSTKQNCKRGSPTGACSTLDTVEAVHLPWLTFVYASTVTTPENAIYEGTGGKPGWLVECETALGKKNDECITNNGKADLEEESGDLNVEFLETAVKEEWAECSEGSPKAEAGLVVGLIHVEALQENTLAPITFS